MTGYVCAYTGPPGICAECGCADPTGTGWCTHDCREAFEARAASLSAIRLARRAADDAFGAEADRLRGLGHTDVEIDEMLRGMP